MRNLVRWIAGLAGIAALARLVRARSRTVPALPRGESTTDELGGEDPAAELRRKLADARSGAPGTTEESAVAVASPEEGTPEAPERSLEERRAEIHARAQDAIESMRNDDA
jgi:hypothetical protein